MRELSDAIETPNDWEKPIPIQPPPPMQFDLNWFPDTLRRFSYYISESLQVAPDMPAIGCLSILALCNAKKFEIEAKSDYREPLNIYSSFIGNPGERKSSAFKLLQIPVLEFERDENERLKPEIARSRSQKSILQKELKKLEESATADAKYKLEALNKAEELSKFQEVNPLRLTADDCTLEKLGNLLSENNGKIGIFSPEGGFFDTLSGIYSSKVNLDIVLKSHAGDNVRVDRLSRESEYINSPALTLFLGIQPEVLRNITNNKSFDGKGLLARFFYVYPESKVGTRIEFETIPIPDNSKRAYSNLIKALLRIPYSDEPKVIKLSADAFKILTDFHREIELRLLTDLESIKFWACKLIGLTLRICGNLHIAENIVDSEKVFVSRETMENAINISRYAIDHAKKAFDEAGADPVLQNCDYIVRKIRENKKIDEISKRDLLRLCRKYHSVNEMAPYIERLEDLGYLELKESEEGKQGRKSDVYLISPYIFKIEQTAEKIPVIFDDRDFIEVTNVIDMSF